MRERPANISDTDIAAALARHWQLTTQDLTYLPVGFGGYHWLALDQTGTRWFVTVTDLTAAWVPDLPAAMQTAAWLATEAALDFVVAPRPTTTGEVVATIDSQHALTLFPYLDATPSHFDDPIDHNDRAEIIDMLAALHTAPKCSIQLPTRPPELPSRHSVDDAVAAVNTPWTGGPYSEPARSLLAQSEQQLRQAFTRFDTLLTRLYQADGPHVITHGEPHPGNLLRTRAGLRLIDWDSIALAQPERDLWWVITTNQDAARYTQRTGRPVNPDALDLFKLRWALDDIAAFVSEIRAPHHDTADTRVSWTSLQQTLESIAQG